MDADGQMGLPSHVLNNTPQSNNGGRAQPTKLGTTKGTNAAVMEVAEQCALTLRLNDS